MSDKDLLEQIKQSEDTDLQLLLTTKEEAKRKLIEDPTNASAMTAFEKASRALKERMADPQANEPAFKNRAAVLRHLNEQGFKIGRQKLYNDVKAGLLRMRPDGTVPESAVTAYINSPMAKLSRPEAIGDPEETERLNKVTWEIKQAELERIKEDTVGKRRKNLEDAGRLIPRDDLEREVIARALALKAFFAQQFRAKVQELIRSVSGRPAQSENLLLILERISDEAFGRFADMTRFQVIVLPEEEEFKIDDDTR
jgi:hypothetical protein